MSGGRRKYTREFKIDAVERMIEDGHREELGGALLLGRLRRGLVALLLLSAAVVPATSMATGDESGKTNSTDTCILCVEDLPVPVVPLSPAWLDSMADARARFNAAQIAQIDSLLKAGDYGPPGQKNSRRTAHLLARLTTINAYRDLMSLAGDSTHLYQASGATLRDHCARYSDVILFSSVRLERVRMGLGHVCIRYNLDEKTEGESMHGHKRVRWRIKDKKIEGTKRRLLSIDLPIGTGEVEVLLAPHHSFSVEYARMDGPPAAYEWFVVHDIQGGWVRKWGLHRPAAYTFWVTPSAAVPRRTNVRLAATVADSASQAPREADPSTAAVPLAPTLDLPATPLVGVRVYIPGLRFRLPLILPDINFDDLRTIELPMPILNMTYLHENLKPSWLGSTDDLPFVDWDGYGPVPPAILERFPDL
jgi:hypothetical protein